MTSIEKYSDRIFENIKPIIMLAKKSVKQLQRKKMNKYSRKRGRFDLVFVAKKALKTTVLSDKILYEKAVTKQ